MRENAFYSTARENFRFLTCRDALLRAAIHRRSAETLFFYRILASLRKDRECVWQAHQRVRRLWIGRLGRKSKGIAFRVGHSPSKCSNRSARGRAQRRSCEAPPWVDRFSTRYPLCFRRKVIECSGTARIFPGKACDDSRSETAFKRIATATQIVSRQANLSRFHRVSWPEAGASPALVWRF